MAAFDRFPAARLLGRRPSFPIYYPVMPRRLLLFALLSLLSLGCVTSPENPSFSLTADRARDALRGMEARPKPLARPLVIVGGYLSMGFGPSLMKAQLGSATGENRRIETVSLFFCGDFDDCRREVIAAVDKAFPSADAGCTTEVDVVGISMGGLAARYAATPAAGGGRRLKIARLFTISSPHRGAVAAGLPLFHTLALQMRSGSDFMAGVARCEPDYPIIPYVRLGDGWVGESNAAPIGRVAWWLPNRPFEGAHNGASTDPRILADIARRLRGEESFTREPAAPLPG